VILALKSQKITVLRSSGDTDRTLKNKENGTKSPFPNDINCVSYSLKWNLPKASEILKFNFRVNI
jgi:hypothetical protein